MDYFLPFYPPIKVENQNFEIVKKTPGDIILQMCAINYNHIMYGSWDIWRNRQNFLSFWATFWPFTPLTTQKKPKILKKWIATPGDIIVLHKCTKNYDHILYCSWDMVRDGCSFCFSFWAIFCLFTPPPLPPRTERVT